MLYFPNMWPQFMLSWADVFFYVFGLVLGVGFAVAFVRRRFGIRATDFAAGGIVLAYFLLHLAAIWILHVDPGRRLGRVPLPAPLDGLAGVMALAICGYPAALMHGCVLGAALCGSQRLWARVSFLCGAVYCAAISESVLATILD